MFSKQCTFSIYVKALPFWFTLFRFHGKNKPRSADQRTNHTLIFNNTYVCICFNHENIGVVNQKASPLNFIVLLWLTIVKLLNNTFIRRYVCLCIKLDLKQNVFSLINVHRPILCSTSLALHVQTPNYTHVWLQMCLFESSYLFHGRMFNFYSRHQ